MSALVVLRAVVAVAASGDPEHQPGSFFRNGFELDNYRLWVDDPHVESQERRWYFVTMIEDSESWHFDILDSIDALTAIPCDTNAFACNVVGQDSLYLVVVSLSPFVTRDTLLAYSISDSASWLPDLFDYCLLRRDSLIAGTFVVSSRRTPFEIIDPNKWGMEVRRVGADRKLARVLYVAEARSVTQSNDFSQILFSLSDRYDDKDPTSKRTGVVFDGATESTHTVSDTEVGVRLLSRLSRTGPYYYLGQRDGTENLFRLDLAGKKKQLTFERCPRCVFTYQLIRDSIEVQTMNCHTYDADKFEPMTYYLGQ